VSTRYTDGGATITLTGDLEAWAEKAMRAALGGALDVIRAEMQKVADEAEAKWYGADGVKRRTGLSGRMDVITTLDIGRGRVTVSLGSTDPRRAGKGKVAQFVHRSESKGGKKILPIFVVSPARKALKKAVPKIGQAMAGRMGGSRG
jgi:hypothetical protein